MASWKKIVALDASPTVNNSFITVDTDDDVNVVAFGNLLPVPLETYGSVAERLTEQASDFNFAVHDNSTESGGSHRKVTFDDIAGALVVDAINVMVDGGYGDIATFSGSTTAVVGDLNNDGNVSTADLLEFLGLFGTTGEPVYDDAIIAFSSCPTTTISNGGNGQVFDGTDADSSNLDLLDISNPTVSQGAFTITTNTSTDLTTLEEGTGVNWNAFTSKKLTIYAQSNAFKLLTNTGNALVEVWMNIKTYNNSNVLLNSYWVKLVDQTLFTTDTAGDDLYLSIPNDIHVGGSGNLENVNINGNGVDSIVLGVYAHDILGNVVQMEIETIGMRLHVNG